MMNGGGWRLVAALAISATTFVLCGCNDARIRTRMAGRDDSVRDVFGIMESLERQRPASVRAVFDSMERAHRGDIDRTPKNLEAVGEGFERDAERFRSRLPSYKAGIEKIVNGQPDRAFDPLLILF